MKRTIIIFFLTVFGITALYANPNLIGTWTADVEHNRSFDTYRISFTADGRCIVSVRSDNAEQETAGNWSYDGALFKLNATFRNAKLSYLPNIQWSSLINFTADNNSFNILGRTATNGSQSQITFFRSDDSYDITFNEKAVPRIVAALSAQIPERSRLAIAGIDSPDADEAAFYANEIERHFVNTGKYTVLNRKDIDAVLKEQNFQMSGYVDDDTYVSIGKFIGANVLITGTISGTGAQKRMVIKAIDMLTSAILSMEPVSL